MDADQEGGTGDREILATTVRVENPYNFRKLLPDIHQTALHLGCDIKCKVVNHSSVIVQKPPNRKYINYVSAIMHACACTAPRGHHACREVIIKILWFYII